MTDKKIILHLCCHIGSDSRFYQLDKSYEVILINKKIGVENFTFNKKVQGIIANPVCTNFSNLKNFNKQKDNFKNDMFLVNHCLRIIRECNPVWWILENPANGTLKNIIGKPKEIYQPWYYGSPWTKKTALWGNFIMPKRIYKNFNDVPKNNDLYIRPNRNKPSLSFLHKSAIKLIPEFDFAINYIENDSDFRSLCSQKFAKAFYDLNK